MDVQSPNHWTAGEVPHVALDAVSIHKFRLQLPFPWPSSACSNERYRLQIFKIRRGSYLHTRLEWSFTSDFHLGRPISQPRCPNAASAVGLCGLHVSSTYSSLGKEKKDCATQLVLWKLSLMTWMMETCLPFILSFLILFPFPVFYSLIEQTKVSAALVQNCFLPLLRVSVPGLNPAAAEWKARRVKIRVSPIRLLSSKSGAITY